jgi:hypothetical protein
MIEYLANCNCYVCLPSQQIDANLDALHSAAKRLNGLGRAMGQEVDEQNKHIDRIIGKASQHSINIFIWQF